MTQENKDILQNLLSRHHELGMADQIDYDKFYLYSIITHSTAIEGSTVTEVEAQLLFDEGIALFEESVNEVDSKGGQKTKKVDRKGGQKTRDSIIQLISSTPSITTSQMATALSINRSALSKHIKRMQEAGIIRHVGPAKGGHWEVVEG